MPETLILRLLTLATESMTLFILTALHHLGRTTFVHTVLALRSQELPLNPFTPRVNHGNF